jgi:phosphohistidine phosphatase
MRHAQAGDAKSDFQRPLTAIGERDARHMARWLLANYPGIDHIYSSAAVRAVSTARIVAEELKISSMTEEKNLYEASVRTMLEQVNEVGDDHQMVVVVGHNPSISYLSDYLTSSPLPGMEAGSVVVIDFENLSWKEISKASGILKKYQAPRDLA